MKYLVVRMRPSELRDFVNSTTRKSFLTSADLESYSLYGNWLRRMLILRQSLEHKTVLDKSVIDAFPTFLHPVATESNDSLTDGCTDDTPNSPDCLFSEGGEKLATDASVWPRPIDNSQMGNDILKRACEGTMGGRSEICDVRNNSSNDSPVPDGDESIFDKKREPISTSDIPRLINSSCAVPANKEVNCSSLYVKLEEKGLCSSSNKGGLCDEKSNLSVISNTVKKMKALVSEYGDDEFDDASIFNIPDFAQRTKKEDLNAVSGIIPPSFDDSAPFFSDYTKHMEKCKSILNADVEKENENTDGKSSSLSTHYNPLSAIKEGKGLIKEKIKENVDYLDPKMMFELEHNKKITLWYPHEHHFMQAYYPRTHHIAYPRYSSLSKKEQQLCYEEFMQRLRNPHGPSSLRLQELHQLVQNEQTEFKRFAYAYYEASPGDYSFVKNSVFKFINTWIYRRELDFKLKPKYSLHSVFEPKSFACHFDNVKTECMLKMGSVSHLSLPDVSPALLYERFFRCPNDEDLQVSRAYLDCRSKLTKQPIFRDSNAKGLLVRHNLQAAFTVSALKQLLVLLNSPVDGPKKKSYIPIHIISVTDENGKTSRRVIFEKPKTPELASDRRKVSRLYFKRALQVFFRKSNAKLSLNFDAASNEVTQVDPRSTDDAQIRDKQNLSKKQGNGINFLNTTNALKGSSKCALSIDGTNKNGIVKQTSSKILCKKIARQKISSTFHFHVDSHVSEISRIFRLNDHKPHTFDQICIDAYSTLENIVQSVSFMHLLSFYKTFKVSSHFSLQFILHVLFEILCFLKIISHSISNILSEKSHSVLLYFATAFKDFLTSCCHSCTYSDFVIAVFYYVSSIFCSLLNVFSSFASFVLSFLSKISHLDCNGPCEFVNKSNVLFFIRSLIIVCKSLLEEIEKSPTLIDNIQQQLPKNYSGNVTKDSAGDDSCESDSDDSSELGPLKLDLIIDSVSSSDSDSSDLFNSVNFSKRKRKIPDAGCSKSPPGKRKKSNPSYSVSDNKCPSSSSLFHYNVRFFKTVLGVYSRMHKTDPPRKSLIRNKTSQQQSALSPERNQFEISLDKFNTTVLIPNERLSFKPRYESGRCVTNSPLRCHNPFVSRFMSVRLSSDGLRKRCSDESVPVKCKKLALFGHKAESKPECTVRDNRTDRQNLIKSKSRKKERKRAQSFEETENTSSYELKYNEDLPWKQSVVDVTKHNVCYSINEVSNVRFLVRFSYHGSTDPTTNAFVCLHPKMEYQAQFGGEVLTAEEIADLWIDCFIRGCRSCLVRINPYTCEILDTRVYTAESCRHEFRTELEAMNIDKLAGVIDELTKLDVGSYLLSSSSSGIEVYSAQFSKDDKKTCLDRNRLKAIQITRKNSMPYPLDLDPNIMFRYHHCNKRVPLLFLPRQERRYKKK